MINIITLIALLLHALYRSTAAQDEDINDLYCQLNNYAKERVLNNLNVFPCKE